EDFMNALKDISLNYYHYSNNEELTIKALCKKANFVPELIFYNHGWFLDNPKLKEIRYSNIKNHFSNKKIKHILFLNKEYSRIDEKLKEIKRYKFDLIFTHLHNFNLFNDASIPVVFLPLACSYKNMSNLRKKNLNDRKYDLFFSGILQNWTFKNLQSDLRKKIQLELFYCLFDFPLLKKLKYKNLNIYWKPFYKNRIKNFLSDLLHGKRLCQNDYYDTLANSKCVLHTESPIGIISTRLFEALGSGAIGLFSISSNAHIIFRENIHYLHFNSIQEFINMVYIVKESKRDSKFQKIADSGRKFVEQKHTWKNRVAIFKKQVEIL
ncbi:glycosyltransferase, partial [Prochlorococcus sp. AH-716-K03]|nr:glycosyltransferase [Prochlorococcus sp. AH-716-K03]